MSSERIDRVRSLMADHGADVVVLTSPASRRHATGFTSAPGTAYSTDVAIIMSSKVELLVSPIHVAWARGESTGVDLVTPIVGGFVKSLTSRLQELGAQIVLLEADAFPYPDGLAVQESLPDIEFKFATNFKESLRQVKDSAEVELLREAALLTDAVFEEFAGWLASGITERQAARWISSRLIERGDGLGFDVIVASGENAARPHHRPSDRVIQEREPVIIDMGARIDGYCGDLTRTLWLGETDEQFRKTYDAVLRAQSDTKAVMSAGRPVADVAMAADTSLQESGFGEYILHSVGHGVGLEIHESPGIRHDMTTSLVANSVVTVEPGVYLPGWGGVRIEDVVVITDDDPVTLTTASKLSFS